MSKYSRQIINGYGAELDVSSVQHKRINLFWTLNVKLIKLTQQVLHLSDILSNCATLLWGTRDIVEGNFLQS